MPSRRRKKTLAALHAAEIALLPSQLGGGYPQLTIRLMAAVGQRMAVEFTSDDTVLGRAEGGQRYAVLDPDPTAGQELTAGRRAAVVGCAQELADALDLKVAAVFSASDAVYCAPSAAAIQSPHPPAIALNPPEVKLIRPLDPHKH